MYLFIINNLSYFRSKIQKGVKYCNQAAHTCLLPVGLDNGGRLRGSGCSLCAAAAAAAVVVGEAPPPRWSPGQRAAAAIVEVAARRTRSRMPPAAGSGRGQPVLNGFAGEASRRCRRSWTIGTSAGMGSGRRSSRRRRHRWIEEEEGWMTPLFLRDVDGWDA